MVARKQRQDRQHSLREPDAQPAMTAERARRIVVGDIHGELSGLVEILIHAGLIDHRKSWAARDTILIQTGDVIDRGPHSRGAVSLLRTLQKEAGAFSSQVVRCCGNHELALLQHDHSFVNFNNPDALAEEFRHEIKEGLLQAAYTDGVRLYTHAGVRTMVYDALVKEIRKARPAQRQKPVGMKTLADHINAVFRAAVAADRCGSRDHCMFWVEHARGGRDRVGGLFWCDYPAIEGSERASCIPQVFGHTPSRGKDLTHARGLRLINVDAGMCMVYGGHLVYLEITSDGALVQHSKNGSGWNRKVLGKEDFAS